MTVKEAYEKLSHRTDKLKVLSCYEYTQLYVFHMSPKNYDGEDRLVNCSYSVNKTTGLVRDFKPFHISIEEYHSGKQIHDYD